ncbi:MAG: hypothetical protein RIR49_590 [Actinomycetota bacterium]|jgi:chromosome segregation ATPase
MAGMSRWRIERRLSEVSARLVALRAELAQVDEQFAVVNAEAEDHAIRALVSETPLADQEARDTRRHAEALARHRAHLIESIGDLERRQDELLDEMAALR